MSYQHVFAEYYDLFHSGKDYGEETKFIVACLKKFSPHNKAINILELACGTGGHAILLAKSGFEVVATDRSADMLRIAETKKGDQDSVVFKQMDMQSFLPFDRKFEAVICLFDSIGYVKTNEAISNIFRQVHSNLIDSGLFIFEFWNAGAMLRSFEPRREKIFVLKDRKIKRISATELDYHNQLARVKYSIFEVSLHTEKLIFEEEHRNRYFLIQEMEMFIRNSGFRTLGLFPGFVFSGEITEDTWHTVAVCQKM